MVAHIDTLNPSASSLEATVETDSATSDNLQVQGSLPESDWFDSANYPIASLVADEFTTGQEPNTLDATGRLTIKDISLPVSFTLSITPGENTDPATASTSFSVDRKAFSLGLESEPNEENVNSAVLIQLDFNLSTGG